MAAGEAYSLYVEPAVDGANEAAGPLSSLQEPVGVNRLERGEGFRCGAAPDGAGEAYSLYVEPAVEGANESSFRPLSSL